MLTEKKKELENNKVLYKIVTNEEIIDFAFNEKHFYCCHNYLVINSCLFNHCYVHRLKTD